MGGRQRCRCRRGAAADAVPLQQCRCTSGAAAHVAPLHHRFCCTAVQLQTWSRFTSEAVVSSASVAASGAPVWHTTGNLLVRCAPRVCQPVAPLSPPPLGSPSAPRLAGLSRCLMGATARQRCRRRCNSGTSCASAPELAVCAPRLAPGRLGSAGVLGSSWWLVGTLLGLGRPSFAPLLSAPSLSLLAPRPQAPAAPCAHPRRPPTGLAAALWWWWSASPRPALPALPAPVRVPRRIGAFWAAR